MHGIIFSELRKYVEARTRDSGWSTLLEKAGLGGKLYMSVGEYPDSDVLALLTAASAVTGHSIAPQRRTRAKPGCQASYAENRTPGSRGSGPDI